MSGPWWQVWRCWDFLFLFDLANLTERRGSFSRDSGQCGVLPGRAGHCRCPILLAGYASGRRRGKLAGVCDRRQPCGHDIIGRCLLHGPQMERGSLRRVCCGTSRAHLVGLPHRMVRRRGGERGRLVGNRREILPKISKRSIAIAVVLGFLICLVAIVPVTERIKILLVDWQQLSTQGDFSTSLGVRVALWEIGTSFFERSDSRPRASDDTGPHCRRFRQQFKTPLTFTHFHNGFLTAAVESGILGLLALIGIFAVLIRNGCEALRASRGPIETFGGLLLLIIALIYLCIGSANLMLGHDILDTMFLSLSAIGTYLGLGRSTLGEPEAERHLVARPLEFSNHGSQE